MSSFFGAMVPKDMRLIPPPVVKAAGAGVCIGGGNGYGEFENW